MRHPEGQEGGLMTPGFAVTLFAQTDFFYGDDEDRKE
jgi:hypothetical protein